MSDVFWVAIVSSGSAIAVALMTQLLSTRAASRSADRSEQKEALQWQRSEALRLEELQRKEAQQALAWDRAEAKEKRDDRVAALHRCWASALSAQNRIMDGLHRASGLPPAAESAASAAAHCYAVALVELPSLREPAKAFYLATADAETVMHAKQVQRLDVVHTWRSSFDALELAVISASESDR